MVARITIEQGDPAATVVPPPYANPDKPQKPPKEKWKQVAEKRYPDYSTATKIFEESLGSRTQIEKEFGITLKPSLAVRIKPWFASDGAWHSHQERVLT